MKHRKVLITGGAGFVGSHLAERLLEKGYEITILDDLSTGNYDNVAHLEGRDGVSLLIDTVFNELLIEDLIRSHDVVFHLASAVGVKLIIDEPVKTIQTIVGGTEIVLRYCSRYRKRVLITSTSEVYGKNPKATWTEEDDLVLGATTKARWSYGASKAIDEFLALACWRQYQLPVVIGRFFNVVGPRQSGAYGMVLPRFVEAARNGQSLVVHDDGQQIRCFSHVHDIIGAVLQLMDTDDALGKVFNIGSDRPVSILELAQMVIQASQSSAEIQFQSYTDAYDADFEDIRRRVPDLSRLKETIDYQPRYDLEAIIAELLAS